MNDQERDLEQWFRRQVLAMGGQSFKWVSPGNTGVPDRIVIWPGGRIDFVELKTATGRLRSVQKRQILRLQAYGAHVYVLYGRMEMEFYLQTVAARGRHHEV